MLLAALSLTWVPPLDALLFTLTPRDRDEAVRAGRRSITDVVHTSRDPSTARSYSVAPLAMIE